MFDTIPPVGVKFPLDEKIEGRDSLDWIPIVVAGMDLAVMNLVNQSRPQLVVVYSLISILFMYSLRSYEMKYLVDLKNQLLRNSTGMALSALIIYVVFKENFFLDLLIFSPILSLLNYVLSRILLYLIPAKTYILTREDYEDLKEIIEEIEEASLNKVRFKVANPHLENYPHYMVLATDLTKSEVYPVTIAELAERYLRRIPLEIFERFEDYYVDIFRKAEREKLWKRILDIAVSLIGILVFSPFMLLTALLILIEDGPPIVFKQARIGKNGKEFIMYKFRTMRDEPRSDGKFAIHEEYRILKTGRIIRKFRLDETLQFFNVLKGDMSIVGPRPEQKVLAEIFRRVIPAYEYRLVVNPGITGWAQLRYKYASDVMETKKKLSYDLWYVKNRNLLLDLRIILQTLEAILFMRGAK